MDSSPRNQSLGQSIRCAWRGLRWAVATQRNLRLQVLVAVLALSLGALAGLDGLHMAILVLTVVGVLSLELLNTALEALLDALFPRWNEQVGRVKDVAAGAVLLAALGSLGVALTLAWELGELAWLERLARLGLLLLMLTFLRLALRRG